MERNRILVVDDDPLIRGSLYEMLRGQRYDVEMASDGSEAMDHLKRRTFQLVITDWKMPQTDGMSLLSYIKSRHPDVNVILITGFGNVSSAVDAIRQGAFDYLTKPIHMGSGLGLTIAKEVVERSGGTIEFTSQRKVGTTFRIRIPAAPQDPTTVHNGTK